MDKETSKYYEDMFDLFQQDGWKRVTETAQKGKEILESAIWDQPDTNEMLRMQGYKKHVEWLLGLEAFTEMAYKEALAEEVEGAIDADV